MAKLLKKDVEKYISVKSLFPNARPNFKTGLTEYQAKKIRKAIKNVKNILGENQNQIVPIGRGRKKYMEQAGLPVYMRGVALSGGEKQNSDVKYIAGELRYKRGKNKSPRSIIRLDTAHGEDGLIKSLKAELKKRGKRKTALTANNRAMAAHQNMNTNQLIIKEALYIYNKYESAYSISGTGAVNEDTENVPSGFIIIGKEIYRDRGKRHGLTKVARPSDWGMGLLFEGEK